MRRKALTTAAPCCPFPYIFSHNFFKNLTIRPTQVSDSFAAANSTWVSSPTFSSSDEELERDLSSLHPPSSFPPQTDQRLREIQSFLNASGRNVASLSLQWASEALLQVRPPSATIRVYWLCCCLRLHVIIIVPYDEFSIDLCANMPP